MCIRTNLAGQIFKFCHYDVIMVKFASGFAIVTPLMTESELRPAKIVDVAKS